MVDLENLFKEILGVINSHDAGAAANLYTEDGVYRISGEKEPLCGKEEIKQSYEMFYKAFPDLSVNPTSYVISGNHISMEATLRGTHTQSMMTPEGEIPPTGKSIEIPLGSILRVSPEGLIEEDRTYYDTAEFFKQLGLAE
jgi:steroid delta-isomerase-like uncharacterized protein